MQKFQTVHGKTLSSHCLRSVRSFSLQMLAKWFLMNNVFLHQSLQGAECQARKTTSLFVWGKLFLLRNKMVGRLWKGKMFFFFFLTSCYKAQKKVLISKGVRLQNSLGSPRRNRSGTRDVLPHYSMHHCKSGSFHTRSFCSLFHSFLSDIQFIKKKSCPKGSFRQII